MLKFYDSLLIKYLYLFRPEDDRKYRNDYKVLNKSEVLESPAKSENQKRRANEFDLI